MGEVDVVVVRTASRQLLVFSLNGPLNSSDVVSFRNVMDPGEVNRVFLNFVKMRATGRVQSATGFRWILARRVNQSSLCRVGALGF